jgi:hypothetical protein
VNDPPREAFGPAVSVPSDAAAALWIAPTLGSFGTVGGLVPHGYERYLLLDYRVEEYPGWDGVCRLFEQLVPLLQEHTSTPDDCWFAIWAGYGFETSATLLAAPPKNGQEDRELERERQRLREDDARRNKSIRAALSTLPKFDLPATTSFVAPSPPRRRSCAPTATSRSHPTSGGQRTDDGSSPAIPISTGATSVDLSDSSPQWRQSSGARYAEWTGRRRTPRSASRDRSPRRSALAIVRAGPPAAGILAFRQDATRPQNEKRVAP